MIQLECQGILFDLDGVLIDSSACILRHWRAWAERHGLELERVMRHAHGMRTIETIRRVAPHLDADREAEAFTAGELRDTAGVGAIPGALTLLECLPAERWGIVTSGSRALATVRLQTAGLPVPGVLVTGDQVPRGKPAPDPYLEGARRLGLHPATCLAVEDAPAGIASAQAAGMPVLGVASTHPRDALDSPLVAERLAELWVAQPPPPRPRLLVRVGPGAGAAEVEAPTRGESACPRQV